MKKRNPFLVIVLSIVTLGIYDLYWLSSTRKVLNQKTAEKVPGVWMLIVPILVLIAGVITTTVEIANSVGTTTYTDPSTGSFTYGDTGSALVLGKLLLYFGLFLTSVVSFYWFWRYSKAVNAYTNGQMSFPVAFLLIWVLHFIGVAFIQDQFNSQLDGHPALPSAPPSPPVAQPTPTLPTAVPPAAAMPPGQMVSPPPAPGASAPQTPIEPPQAA
jgi:hypothetical protein